MALKSEPTYDGSEGELLVRYKCRAYTNQVPSIVRLHLFKRELTMHCLQWFSHVCAQHFHLDSQNTSWLTRCLYKTAKPFVSLVVTSIATRQSYVCSIDLMCFHEWLLLIIYARSVVNILLYMLRI